MAGLIALGMVTMEMDWITRSQVLKDQEKVFSSSHGHSSQTKWWWARKQLCFSRKNKSQRHQFHIFLQILFFIFLSCKNVRFSMKSHDLSWKDAHFSQLLQLYLGQNAERIMGAIGEDEAIAIGNFKAILAAIAVDVDWFHLYNKMKMIEAIGMVASMGAVEFYVRENEFEFTLAVSSNEDSVVNVDLVLGGSGILGTNVTFACVMRLLGCKNAAKFISFRRCDCSAPSSVTLRHLVTKASGLLGGARMRHSFEEKAFVRGTGAFFRERSSGSS